MDETKRIQINEYTKIEDVRGKYAWNDNWNCGGYIEEGGERGVVIGGKYYSTITGDSLYDSLTINGFKVYEPEK